MADRTGIQWTDATWNPVTGCTKVSDGCRNCYAETMARRLQAMGQEKYSQGFAVAMHPETLSVPGRWKRPRKIFVNSMSDLFHPEVTKEFILQVFHRIQESGQHTFQVLTKRPERALELASSLPWPANLWLGTSIESPRWKNRIETLRQVPAETRFLSLEPLLEDLGPLDLEGIQWAIAGGESGAGHRPIEPDWVRSIRDQCQDQEVSFFFKQWGGSRPSENGRNLDGREHLEFPQMRQAA